MNFVQGVWLHKCVIELKHSSSTGNVVSDSSSSKLTKSICKGLDCMVGSKVSGDLSQSRGVEVNVETDSRVISGDREVIIHHCELQLTGNREVVNCAVVANQIFVPSWVEGSIPSLQVGNSVGPGLVELIN